MRRLLISVLAGVFLVVALGTVAGGERKVSDAKKTTSVEKKGEPASTTSEDAKPKDQPAVGTSIPDDAYTMPELESFEAGLPMNPTADDEAADYAVPWKSIIGGGGNAATATHKVSVSIGQTLIGRTASADHQAGIGYWYGVETGPEICDCGDPWGDLNGDHIINPVEVVFMANYVYKYIDQRPPMPNCPLEPGNVNCDDIVNPVDVVHYCNYVYKNITPLPCADPCL